MSVRSGINAGMKWIAGSSIHGCWLGHYEHEKQQLVRSLIKPGMTVFDIGANAGFYTLAFSRLVGPTGHVWAFEPFAENASNVLRHLALNQISNVTLIQAAVADKAGLTGFNIAPSNSMGTVTESVGTYSVPVIALDALIETGAVRMPDVIKMDVEGAESRVLEGAARILNEGTTSLLIALHGAEQVDACLSLLSRVRYQVFRLDGQAVFGSEANLDEIYAVPPTNASAAPAGLS
jgi:FkbM family methyltransferase